MPDPRDEYDPSPASRRVLRWAQEHGATTLGDAVDLLEQFEVGNDVPEVLGHDDTVEEVREDLEYGLGAVGPDVEVDDLL